MSKGNGSNGHFSVRETLAGKHFLVTGVTGFLGKVWVAMVLTHARDVGRLTVLVRGKKTQSAADRFDEILRTSPAFRRLREELGSDLLTLARDKIDVVEGDCADPGCGIDAGTLDRLAPTVDAVVHFAGLTDFEPDPTLAIAVNVRGASHAADVAARCRGRLLLHCSTCYVAGCVSGDVPETLDVGVTPLGEAFDAAAVLEALSEDLAALDTRTERVQHANEVAAGLGWPNIYTLTKGLGEHVLGGREDVEVVMVRPAIVECAREYPFPGWNEGLNTSGPLVWLFSTSFRHFPSRPRNRFDVIPVDTVARSTTVILAEALRGRADAVYHLGSSHLNPLLFERAIDLTNLGVRRMHREDGATRFERLVMSNLDVRPVRHGDDGFLGVKAMRRVAQRARDALRRLDLEEELPPSLWDKYGERLQARVKSAGMQCRNTDRKLGRVEDMLRLYKPFVHDHDYRFRTDRVRRLDELLTAAERAVFGFDIETLDWRSYWLDVQIPGLEKWSLPVLRGDKVQLDPRLTDPAVGPECPAEPPDARPSLPETERQLFR